MDYQKLNQLTDLGRDVDSEFPKPKRGRKKKADTRVNELEDNDVRDKRERLVACVLSGNSKMYLGKEYAEEQINKMDCNDVNTLLNRYESISSAQMTKSLGKRVINLYSNIACSVLGVGNQQELSTNLECDPFLNTAMQRFTCDLYYWFGALLAHVSVGIITGKHYAKNSITKLSGVMHEADDPYSIWSTWSCYWLDQFLTLALNILILSIFYISVDLSANYFAHFSGC